MTSSDESRTAPPIDREQLAALHEAATESLPLPWGEDGVCVIDSERKPVVVKFGTSGIDRAVTDFIVYLVNHTPAILAQAAEVERLKFKLSECDRVEDGMVKENASLRALLARGTEADTAHTTKEGEA